MTATDAMFPRSAPASSGLKRLARTVRSAISARVVVLLYHRIGDRGGDPHDLAVAPERFEEQVEAMRAFGPVLSLAELARRLETRTLPRRATVITFDDGYADNLYLAKPILERHATPATVFMTTGPIGRQREFWWDELQRILLAPGALPEQLSLTISGTVRRFTVESESPRAVHDEIYRLVWDLDHDTRQGLIDQLLAQLRRTPVVRADRRALNDDEVLQLAEGGLVEIGAHTHTHPNLAAQSLAVQDREIRTSKARLDELLGGPTQSFAYPFGLHTADTVKLVREAGFSRACACMGHAVRLQSEMHRLTRADLGDLDGDAFSRILRQAVSW